METDLLHIGTVSNRVQTVATVSEGPQLNNIFS